MSAMVVSAKLAAANGPVRLSRRRGWCPFAAYRLHVVAFRESVATWRDFKNEEYKSNSGNQPHTHHFWERSISVSYHMVEFGNNTFALYGIVLTANELPCEGLSSSEEGWSVNPPVVPSRLLASA